MSSRDFNFDRCPLEIGQGCERDAFIGAAACELGEDCAAPLVTGDEAPAEQVLPQQLASEFHYLGPMMPGHWMMGDI